MPVILVLTTTPDIKTAKKIAKFLVLKRAAACVSFRDGFSSIYRWKGRVKNSRETLLLIKTEQRKFPLLKSLLENHHPYDVPEILALKAHKVSEKYLSWIKESVW